jgi:hypothetical protein
MPHAANHLTTIGGPSERPFLRLVRERPGFRWCAETITDDAPMPIDGDVLEAVHGDSDEIRDQILSYLFRGREAVVHDTKLLLNERFSQIAAMMAAAKVLLLAWGNGVVASCFERIAEIDSDAEYRSLRASSSAEDEEGKPSSRASRADEGAAEDEGTDGDGIVPDMLTDRERQLVAMLEQGDAQDDTFMSRIRVAQYNELAFPVLGKPDESAVELRVRQAYEHMADLERAVLDGFADAARRGDYEYTFLPSDVVIARLVGLIASWQTEDEQDAANLLGVFLHLNTMAEERSPFSNALALLGSEDRDSFHMLRRAWLGRWFTSGLPTIRLQAPVAAALIFTDVPPEVLAEVNPPWAAFSLILPDGFLPSYRTPGGFWRSIGVHAAKVGDIQSWGYYAVDSARKTLDLNRQLLAELCIGWSPEDLLGGDKPPTTEMRAGELLGRLNMGVCTMANDATAIRRVKGPKGQRSRWRLSKEPLTTDYVLGRDVRMAADFSPSVREYATAVARRMPAVQWPVRGHFRSQPHGPERALRKRVWIHPHWKGAADAPRLVRSHALRGPDLPPSNDSTT